MLQVLLCKGADLLPGSADGMSGEGHPFGDGGAGAGLPEVFQAVAETAALMGGERDDGLAAEVVRLQEGQHAHRHRAAPAGPSDEDDIIGIRVDVGLEGRAGAAFQLLLGDGADGFIRIGIRGVALDPEEIGPGGLADHLSEQLRVALFQLDDPLRGIGRPGQGEIHDEGVVLLRTRTKCGYCCHYVKELFHNQYNNSYCFSL